jgi:hypothetical protein
MFTSEQLEIIKKFITVERYSYSKEAFTNESKIAAILTEIDTQLLSVLDRRHISSALKAALTAPDNISSDNRDHES